MKLGLFLTVLLALLGVMSHTALGQTDREKNSQTNLLPPVTQPAGCSLVLRYVDDALFRAPSYKSNVIVIIKMKNAKNLTLARTRSNNLRWYYRSSEVKNLEVVVDLVSNDLDKIDLYVRGELLYSLPIKNGDKLSFVNC